MHVSVLGPVRIVDGEGERTIRSTRRRHLLAALASSVGERVSTDRLTEALWGEDPPASSAAALQVHVSDLRSLLDPDRPARQDGGYIETVPDGYRLDLRPGQLDWTRAIGLAEAGRGLRAEARHVDAELVLAEALRGWSAPAYADARSAGAANADWLDGVRLDVEDDLLATSLAAGRADQVAADAADRLREEPYRERRAALLVLALYRANRQAEALAVYETVRRRLRDDIGCDPGPELQALQQAVLEHDPRLALLALSPEPAADRVDHTGGELLRLTGPDDAVVLAEAALWRTATVVERHPEGISVRGDSHAIRAAVSDEQEHSGATTGAAEVDDGSRRHGARRAERPRGPVGRGREVDAVRRALEDHVLVSVVGPPGAGTSTVVAAAAADLDVPVHRLDLSRHRPQAEATAALAAVGDVDGVLVVDDADVAAAEVVDLVARLTADGPPPRVLVSGRSRLGVPGEAVVEVGPLPVADAIRLLVERAGPDRAPDDVEAAALVRAVDRLPLAIELLAPAVRTLGAGAVLERLDATSGVWGSALPGGPALDQAIGWSHRRLSPRAAGLLDRMTVFADAATLDDLEAVITDETLPVDDVAPALAELVEASLVTPRAEADGLTYRPYALVAAFARGRTEAGGDERLHRRHADHVASCLREAGRAAGRSAPAGARRRIERSRRDLDRAVAWLESAGEVDPHLALADGLLMYWFSTASLAEGRAFTARALERGGSPGARSRCLTTAAVLALFEGDHLSVAGLLAEIAVLDAAPPREPLAMALHAAVAWLQGDLDEAAARAARAEKAAERSGRPIDLAMAAVTGGTVAWFSRRPDAAVHDFRRAVEIGSREGYLPLTALARRGLALNLALSGQVVEARAAAAAACSDADLLGDATNRGQARAAAGLVEVAAGSPDSAGDHLRSGLELSATSTDLFGILLGLMGLVVVATEQGRPEEALLVDGWLAAWADEPALPVPPREQDRRRDAVASAEQAVPPDRCAAARHRGRSLRPDELVEALRSP